MGMAIINTGLVIGVQTITLHLPSFDEDFIFSLNFFDSTGWESFDDNHLLFANLFFFFFFKGEWIPGFFLFPEPCLFNLF